MTEQYCRNKYFKYYYDLILSDMASHYKRPSFTSNVPASAKTYEMEYANGSYSVSLTDNPNISKVYLCLDNDEAGQSAAKRISDKLFIKGIQHEILVPIHKDWNEDLLYPVEESEAEEPCQMLQL